MKENRGTLLCLLLLSVVIVLCGCHQTENTILQKPAVRSKICVGTMGASLMYPDNGWVEQACANLNIACLNKAVSGETTVHFAQKLWKNEYATSEELAQIDILLVQFANCRNVYGDSTTFYTTADEYTKNYTEFSNQLFREYSSAQQMDYILKKWQEICKQYRKPMHIIFVTHWHDGRVSYNENVRKLAKRWNADVCELDKYIGFTKDEPLADGTQPSIQYAVDTETINGELFGWHPLRGEKGEYIQSVMARILQTKLEEYIKTNNVK